LNLKGDSGVTHYEIGEDFIRLQFRGSAIFVYDYTMPGKLHVDRMKALAAAGRGLATYVNQHVRSRYARKE
jgi:hypothetical protein